MGFWGPKSIQTCQKILCFIVVDCSLHSDHELAAEGGVSGWPAQGHAPEASALTPKIMGTLMAEVQNKNTSGNMWKKCSMPLKAHELLLADLNMRCQKVIDFYGCFWNGNF